MISTKKNIEIYRGRRYHSWGHKYTIHKFNYRQLSYTENRLFIQYPLCDNLQLGKIVYGHTCATIILFYPLFWYNFKENTKAFPFCRNRN